MSISCEFKMRVIACVLFLSFGFAECLYLKESVSCFRSELNKNITVDTSNGKIRGVSDQTETGGTNFYSFQSIPYAQPPIGDLRFKYPKAPENWTGILDATSPSKSCLQPYLTNDEMSEDCLYLNVFTPCLSPTTLLPVVFWIHGGYFMVGNGLLVDGEPDLFVDKNVVLVSVNYRLGIFGYLSTLDDILPGNYGIKDQIMALEWVQKNIASFGGDPNRVTIMGQSAGAANVGLLVQTPLAKGLFSAAILESGNSLNLWSRTKDPSAIADLVGNYFKIDYNTSDQLRFGLQQIDALELLKGADNVDLVNTAFSNPMDGLLFSPTIEPLLRGAVTGLAHQKLRMGYFNRVPILTGYNSAEGCMFLSLFDTIRLLLEMYDLQPSRLAPADLNTNKTMLSKIGKMIKSTYFQNRTIASSRKNFVKFITDHEFSRPAVEFVRQVSKYSPTYLYRFDYVGQFIPNNGSEREVKGANHGEELNYLFHHSEENPLSKTDLATRERLITMWTNFAKYHNPTPVVDPVLQNVIWQAVDPTNINYLNIDENLKLKKNPDETYMQFWSSVYKNYGIPPFDTY